MNSVILDGGKLDSLKLKDIEYKREIVALKKEIKNFQKNNIPTDSYFERLRYIQAEREKNAKIAKKNNINIDEETAPIQLADSLMTENNKCMKELILMKGKMFFKPCHLDSDKDILEQCSLINNRKIGYLVELDLNSKDEEEKENLLYFILAQEIFLAFISKKSESYHIFDSSSSAEKMKQIFTKNGFYVQNGSTVSTENKALVIMKIFGWTF